ncbi:hypothetical protein L249_5209 [Ophiocordyceps polyrhachis-furcata BCC 54312]|uniref:Uncharacterized protein n=1 Tax=Ophiocordyceps polyrhachis-furcata BCC 54312 TaxID=1330021 RepID=A0A367L8Y2_9HYPO|nr:hypothetical protein L249_5209 [Ophiocordyceps polyrhachis-furcata BCC 54312]
MTRTDEESRTKGEGQEGFFIGCKTVLVQTENPASWQLKKPEMKKNMQGALTPPPPPPAERAGSEEGVEDNSIRIMLPSTPPSSDAADAEHLLRPERSAGHQLTVFELHESFLIVRACSLAHGIRKEPTLETMERFFRAIFRFWDGAFMPVVMPPVEMPVLSTVLSAASVEEVAVHFSKLADDDDDGDDGDREPIRLYFHVTINHQAKTVYTSLRNEHNQPFLGDRDTLLWRHEEMVQHLYHETLAHLCDRVDAEFLAYNEKRAVRYIRNIIAANTHGQRRLSPPFLSGGYVFASSASYLCSHFPLLWAAAWYRGEVPEMWLGM